MPHIYTCMAPNCQHTIYLDAATPRPWMQQYCTMPGCSGRLDWVRTEPGPVAPPAPAAPSMVTLNYELRPRVINRAGTFCSYTLTYNPATYSVTFAGDAGGQHYAFTMEGYRRRAQFLPATFTAPGLNATSCSEFFVMNPDGAQDWMTPPDPLPENRSSGKKSFGHGKGMSSPLRIQFGSQDADNQHSGSGLIHMMFSHQKQDIRGVYDILRSVLLPQNIGAIYKTKQEVFGHFRIIFLSRSMTPNCIRVRPESSCSDQAS